MIIRKITIIIILFNICSCNEPQEKKLYTDKGLKNIIQNKIISGQNILDLSKINYFDWDSLLIITPYAPYKTIEDTFKIDLSLIKHSNLGSRDDINQIIFFSNGKITKMVEYPRYPGDFSDNKIEFIRKNNAIFDITNTEQKNGNGDKWIKIFKR